MAVAANAAPAPGPFPALRPTAAAMRSMEWWRFAQQTKPRAAVAAEFLKRREAKLSCA